MDYPSETGLQCTVAPSPTDTPSPIFFWGEGAAVPRLSETDNPSANCPSSDDRNSAIVSKWGVEKKTGTHCLLRRAGFFFFYFFFLNRKKLQINQSNDLYQTEKLKEKKRKKERSTHTTFLANAIVRFVLQAVRKFSFHKNKKFSWKSN